MATMLKLSKHPELVRLSRLERVVISASVWPQSWLFQVIQSSIDPRKMMSNVDQSSSLDALQVLIYEFRSLNLHQAECGLLEALIIGGKGNIL